MHNATPDSAADLLELVTQAIAAAAADRGGESLHRAQARAALAAIEAAGLVVLPRPAQGVRTGLGDALATARGGSGASGTEGGDDIHAAQHWLHSVAAILDRMPEG